MGFRNIVITTPAKLSMKHNQIIIGDASVPLEDINTIVVENLGSTMTASLINSISQYGIACYVCDEKHLPSTVVLPLGRHSRHFQMLEAQMHISRVLQKRLWKDIVKQKILNQSLCLKVLGRDGEKTIYDLCSEVMTDDKSNMEAKAARMYFRFLYGDDFNRREESFTNSMLNYCYAIIRGQIARTVVVHGLEPSIALKHQNQLNSFNLVDDLIEPYRAMADYYVSDYLEQHKDLTEFSSDEKRYLLNILQQDVWINGGNYTIPKSIDLMVASYRSVLTGQREDMQLPKLIHHQNHRYE